MDKPQAQTSYSHLHSHVLYKSSCHCCCDLAINQSIWNKTCVVQLWWAWMNYILCFLFLANGTGIQCSLLLQQPICSKVQHVLHKKNLSWLSKVGFLLFLFCFDSNNPDTIHRPAHLTPTNMPKSLKITFLPHTDTLLTMWTWSRVLLPYDWLIYEQLNRCT